LSLSLLLCVGLTIEINGRVDAGRYSHSKPFQTCLPRSVATTS